eukprot:1028757-Rhodomonas_salina.1
MDICPRPVHAVRNVPCHCDLCSRLMTAALLTTYAWNFRDLAEQPLLALDASGQSYLRAHLRRRQGQLEHLVAPYLSCKVCFSCGCNAFFGSLAHLPFDDEKFFYERGFQLRKRFGIDVLQVCLADGPMHRGTVVLPARGSARQNGRYRRFAAQRPLFEPENVFELSEVIICARKYV